MTIPEVAHGDHVFWERIDNAREVHRIVTSRLLKFFIQPTRADCIHCCTVDDIARLISHVPPTDWEGLEAVVLRQPRRKEQTLASVWGRLAYAADLVDERGEELYSGPAIVIEALNPAEPIKFGKCLSPDDTAELERLRLDGHKIRSAGRNHTIEPTLESCRATQLYRTMLHELGHWVDFLEKVERPCAGDGADVESNRYARLLDRYHSRPDREKEHFAHRYAERLRKHLGTIRSIPFCREFDPDRLIQDGLRLQDFAPPHA